MSDDRRRLPPLTRQSLAACVERDLTTRAIAAEVGRSQTTIRYWLRRYDLETTAKARRSQPVAARTVGVCKLHGEGVFVRIGGRDGCARCRADAVSEWRRRAKATLVAEAGGCCVRCGYDRCHAALHFHHVDPATKRFAIGGRGLARAIDDLRAEAAKCVLLCANCHVEVEAATAIILPAAPDRG